MHDFQDDTHIIACDGKKCYEVFETHTDNWASARMRAVKAGWYMRINPSPMYLCPDCKQEKFG